MRRLLILFAHGVWLLASASSVASPMDEDVGTAPQSEFPGMTAAPVRIGVMINGHWKGYSWLRIRDDGQPCALVSHWLEWGVAPTAPFQPDSDVATHTRCVAPDRPAPRMAAAPDGTPAVATPAVPGNEPGKDDEDDDDDTPLVRRRYDAQRHQLTIRVDNDIMSRARGDVPFSRHDDGITAFRLDYRVNASRTTVDMDGSSHRQNAVYATLNPGINVGPWRARSTFNYSRDGTQDIDGGHDPHWTREATYLTRDIGRWRSRVLLGEGNTDSLLFDSIPFTGASMSSEDSLLPDYLEAFTPVVRGIASSNAEVLIRQRGVLFYHTTVAPGPFILFDVRPPSSSGDISVTVREADGTEHVSVVPYTAMPLLTHGKVWKYAFNAGRYRPVFGNDYPRDAFLQATAGYGLPHKLSVYGGLLSTAAYQGTSAGMGWDLDKWGAVSFDVVRSRVRENIADAAGRQSRLRYAKSIAATGTGISLDVRRYGGGHYRSLETLMARDQQFAFWSDLVGEDEAAEWVREISPRTQVRMEFKQNVGDTGSLYATLSRHRYAGDTPMRMSAQLGMTWYGSHFDLDVQATHNRIGSSGTTSAQVSLSIPLGASSGTTLRYGASGERDEDGRMTWNNRVSGSALRDYRLNYVLGQKTVHGDSAADESSARFTYQGDAGRWGLGYTQGRGRQRADASLEGSVIAWADGLVLGQSLGETVGILDAPGFPDSSIDGQLATRTDARGRAVVSYLTPYRVNRLGLDGITLGDRYDFDSLFREVVPTSGAILRVPIHPEPMTPLLP